MILGAALAACFIPPAWALWQMRRVGRSQVAATVPEISGHAHMMNAAFLENARVDLVEYPGQHIELW